VSEERMIHFIAAIPVQILCSQHERWFLHCLHDQLWYGSSLQVVVHFRTLFSMSHVLDLPLPPAAAVIVIVGLNREDQDTSGHSTDQTMWRCVMCVGRRGHVVAPCRRLAMYQCPVTVLATS